jgi:hypothetical protein
MGGEYTHADPDRDPDTDADADADSDSDSHPNEHLRSNRYGACGRCDRRGCFGRQARLP